MNENIIIVLAYIKSRIQQFEDVYDKTAYISLKMQVATVITELKGVEDCIIKCFINKKDNEK